MVSITTTANWNIGFALTASIGNDQRPHWCDNNETNDDCRNSTHFG
jgi:hypothetical protein